MNINNNKITNQSSGKNWDLASLQTLQGNLDLLEPFVQKCFEELTANQERVKSSELSNEDCKKVFKKVANLDFCRPFIGKSLTFNQFAVAALVRHFFTAFSVPKNSLEDSVNILKKFRFCITQKPSLLTRLPIFNNDSNVKDLASLLICNNDIKVTKGFEIEALLSNLMQLQLEIERKCLPLVAHLEKEISNLWDTQITTDQEIGKFLKYSSFQDQIKNFRKQKWEGLSQLMLISNYMRKRLHLLMVRLSFQSQSSELNSLHIREFIEQVSQLFDRFQNIEERLLSIDHRAEYFCTILYGITCNVYSKHLKDFFEKEYNILLSHQLELFKKIITKCDSFWDPLSMKGYIYLIRCINNEKLSVRNENHKRVIGEIKKITNDITCQYITAMNKYFKSLGHINNDEELLKELFDSFLNVYLCQFTDCLENLQEDVPTLVNCPEDPQMVLKIHRNGCYSLLKKSEGAGSFMDQMDSIISLDQYIRARQSLKRKYDRFLQLPEFIKLAADLPDMLKTSSNLIENYFLTLKSAYGDLFLPILQSLMNELEVNQVKDWELKYRNLSWADDLSLAKSKKTLPKKKRRKRRKTKRVLAIAATPQPSTPIEKTVQKVTRSFIQQMHHTIAGCPFKPLSEAAQFRSQSEALKADQLYYLDHLDLMVSLIKKASDRGYHQLLQSIIPQLINTCYLLEELSTTPAYLQRFPHESMTHGLVLMNRALGRQVSNDLDKGTLWYRYPYGSMSIIRRKPRGLQMILGDSVETQEMLSLCQDAIKYMVERMPHDNQIETKMNTYLDELSQLTSGEPTSCPETRGAQVLTTLEKKLENITITDETQKTYFKDFLYHLGQLKVALQLIEAFPENEFLTLHQRNLTYAGQYLVETAGVLLSALNGEEVRTHNLKVYVYKLKNFGELSQSSLKLIDRLNTKKGIDYPNFFFFSKNKIPQVMHQLSSAYQASWIAHHHGEDFQSASKKGQFSLSHIQALGKQEVKLAFELVNKIANELRSVQKSENSKKSFI